MMNRYKWTSVLVVVLTAPTTALWASGEVEGAAAAPREMVVNWQGESVEKPQHGGVLNIATAFTAVDSWDQWRYHQTGTPFTAGVYQAFGAIDIRTPIEDNQFQTSMFTWDQWYGIIAESWEQTDPLTITVNVRQGIKWQNKAPMNGRELTADDVVFTLHRQYGLGSGYTEKSPYLGDPHVEWLAGSTVTALDSYTVQVVTDVPRPFLGFALMCFGCGLVIQPMEVIQEHGDLEDWRNAVGTGAWMLEDYVPGSRVQYSRNPDYWENDPRYPGQNLQLPYADQLNYLMIPDESTRLAALRTGKIAQAGGQQQNIDWRTAEGLQSTNPELNFLEVAGSGGNAWGFSIRVDREPFDDIRVRQAIAMAVNTQEITEDYYGGNAEEYPYPALSLSWPKQYIKPISHFSAEVQDTFGYHPEKAKALLAEAGYADGFETDMPISAIMDLELYELAVSYLAAVGIDVDIRVMEHGVYKDIEYAGEYDGMFSQYDPMSNLPPYHVLAWYQTDIGWNASRVSDPEYERLREAVLQEPDPAKQNEMFHRLYEMPYENTWIIPFALAKEFVFWQPCLKGFRGEEKTHGCDQKLNAMKYAWIDQDLQSEMGHS